MTGARLVVAGAALLVLGAALRVDSLQQRCVGKGGHYELLKLRCIPGRPILLERDLKRSAIGDQDLASN